MNEWGGDLPTDKAGRKKTLLLFRRHTAAAAGIDKVGYRVPGKEESIPGHHTIRFRRKLTERRRQIAGFEVSFPHLLSGN